VNNHSFLTDIVVEYLLKAVIVKWQQLAVTRQRPVNNIRVIMISSVVRADGCSRYNGISCTIDRTQLHCKRGRVLSTRSVSRCYKQDQWRRVRIHPS
jgi:hypothetical protein